MDKKLKLMKKTIAELSDQSFIVGGNGGNNTLALAVCVTRFTCATQDKQCLSIGDCPNTYGLCGTTLHLCQTEI